MTGARTRPVRALSRVPAPAGSAPARPKYRQLRDALVELIEGLPAGATMPTERELCERFAVSRGTVRQALDRLEAEQRIVRHQGKGTFVASAKLDQLLELTSHTESMRSQGRTPASRVLSVERARADATTAQALGVAPGAPLVRVERVRLGDGEPLAVELVSLDAARFEGIEASLGDSSSLYQVLRDRYGVELASAEETIEAVPAGEREADLLAVALGAPLLMLCRVSRDDDDRPVEYVHSLYRADRFRFRTRLRPARDVRRRGLPAGTELRVAAPADADALAEVFIAAWRASYRGIVEAAVLDRLDADDLADWLATLTASPATTTWTATASDGRVLGFARAGADPADSRRGHVYSLYVHPDARGLGVGTALLEHGLSVLEEQGLAPVTLWVFEQNRAARRLYAAAGFAPDGARRIEPDYGAEEIRLLRPAAAGRPAP